MDCPSNLYPLLLEGLYMNFREVHEIRASAKPQSIDDLVERTKGYIDEVYGNNVPYYISELADQELILYSSFGIEIAPGLLWNDYLRVINGKTEDEVRDSLRPHVLECAPCNDSYWLFIKRRATVVRAEELSSHNVAFDRMFKEAFGFMPPDSNSDVNTREYLAQLEFNMNAKMLNLRR